MSLRPRRALVGFLAAAAAFAALPASALATGETLTVTPSNTQAGGNPSITSALHFAPGPNDAPKTVVLAIAPGMLANLNAAPSCLSGSPQLNVTCLIGSATVGYTSSGTSQTADGTLYLIPPQHPGEFAGIETVLPANLPSLYTGATLRTTPNVGFNLTTTLPDTRGSNVVITDVSDTLDPTLAGQPFTRLPSSCSAATSTLSVVYYSGATGTASSSFAPTGCAALPYAPNLAVTVMRAKKGNGATIIAGITQTVGEAANSSMTLALPSGLTPNLTADVPCLNATGCRVGSASATSPLVPSIALADGTVTLSGAGSAPSISISFPPPLAFTITGTVSLAHNSVTFSNLPDIPITNLTLEIAGANSNMAFSTDCAPGDITGSFTGQNGATHSVHAPITLTGCPPRPVTKGSTTGGLASGHPRLTLPVARGKGAPDIASVAIELPRGLRFSRSAFVTTTKCTTKNHNKKCTTTTLIKGLGISGAKAKSVAIRNGRLVVTLGRAARKVTLSLSGPLLAETRSLQSKVKHHTLGRRLTFTLKVTDAKHNVTTVPVKLRAH